MAAVPDVTITSGLPTAGTGTVATLSKFEKAASTGSPVSTDPALAVTIRDINPNGSQADSASAPVAFSTEGKAQLGSLTETAPASDTASSGLNGRLQRVAQRLTSMIALLPTALGATTTSGSLAVTLPNDQAASVAATFTPAASSHVAGDVNGGAQTFAAMGLSGRPIMITGASLEIDGGTAEATAWRLYLYNVTPPSATADDGAWDLPSGDRASFLGYVDLGTAVDLGSTQWVETQGINKQVKLSGTALFAYLVNTTTLTPAAVAHIVTLHAVQL